MRASGVSQPGNRSAALGEIRGVTHSVQICHHQQDDCGSAAIQLTILDWTTGGNRAVSFNDAPDAKRVELKELSSVDEIPPMIEGDTK